MERILKAIREPSTWAAISILLGMVGFNPVIVAAIGQVIDVAPAVLQLIGTLGGVGAAAAAVALPEGGG